MLKKNITMANTVARITEELSAKEPLAVSHSLLYIITGG